MRLDERIRALQQVNDSLPAGYERVQESAAPQPPSGNEEAKDRARHLQSSADKLAEQVVALLVEADVPPQPIWRYSNPHRNLANHGDGWYQDGEGWHIVRQKGRAYDTKGYGGEVYVDHGLVLTTDLQLGQFRLTEYRDNFRGNPRHLTGIITPDFFWDPASDIATMESDVFMHAVAHLCRTGQTLQVGNGPSLRRPGIL